MAPKQLRKPEALFEGTTRSTGKKKNQQADGKSGATQLTSGTKPNTR